MDYSRHTLDELFLRDFKAESVEVEGIFVCSEHAVSSSMRGQIKQDKTSIQFILQSKESNFALAYDLIQNCASSNHPLTIRGEYSGKKSEPGELRIHSLELKV